MKSDIHSALSSVGEVAVFAWSLLELLLTRILPLLSFLIGHLLLQCFRFFAAIFNPAAAAARQRKLSRWDDEQQQSRHGDLNPIKTTAAAADSVEDVILDDYELLQNQQLPTASQADPRAEALLKNTVSSPAEDPLPLPQVAHLKPTNGQTADLLPSAPPINGEQSAMPPAPSEAANVATLDAQAINDCAPKQMQEVERPSERSDQEVSDSMAVKKVSERDVESAPISEVFTDRQAGAAPEMGTSAAPDGEGETAKSGRTGSRKRPALMRVLPPSLSQIKRTLMQRSRRGPSPPSSSASPKPSPLNMKMKRQSPRLRKLASAMISPAAYDNFLGAFRKHFLLDSA